MKTFFMTLFVLGTLVQQNIMAQSPVFTYTTPNTFKIGNVITELIPNNTGGMVNGAIISTIAGNGLPGSMNGTGVLASFYYPTGIVADALGNMYVADNYNHKIRKITPLGEVTTFAGSGVLGSKNGNGISATFNNPYRIAIDTRGNLFVADSGNHKIRKITPSGDVTTFAGNGVRGFDDGIGSNSSFDGPAGLVFDSFENLYVADSNNQKIRKITPDGVVSTFAGSGNVGAVNGTALESSFKLPSGIGIDKSNNLYIADTYNRLIRKITPEGMVSTLAGTGQIGSVDGNAENASFDLPINIVIDMSGNVIVADLANNKIRKISPEGIVSTIAGTGEWGSTDGPALNSLIIGPYGLDINPSGDLSFTTGDHKVKRLCIKKGSYSISPLLPQGLIFDTETGIIKGTPTVILPTTNFNITATNQEGSSSFIITMEINDISPDISYSTPNNFTKDEIIDTLTPNNVGGTVLSYEITPNLPNGLTFDTSTGIISGTPNEVTTIRSYAITASNSGGLSTYNIQISINKGLPVNSHDIEISEAITPNGDNINDTFVIKNIENYSNSIVRVFNRWGTEVFVTKNYQNDWDGHYKNNSKALPESSSYYYQIDLDGDGSYEKQGWIYITK